MKFSSLVSIFLGGALKWITGQLSANRGTDERAEIDESGTLLASGLVSGEAITGILLAVAFVSGLPSLAQPLTGSDQLSSYPTLGGPLSLLGFAAIAWVLIRIPLRR